MVLDDTATSISKGSFSFPGLPPSILTGIDEQVAALDADILAGVPPVMDDDEEDDEQEDQDEIQVDLDAEEGDEGVTGQSLSMDME